MRLLWPVSAPDPRFGVSSGRKFTVFAALFLSFSCVVETAAPSPVSVETGTKWYVRSSRYGFFGRRCVPTYLHGWYLYSVSIVYSFVLIYIRTVGLETMDAGARKFALADDLFSLCIL